MTMQVLRVNGTRREFSPDDFPQTVADLIGHLGLDEKAVVAEVQGVIVPQEEFATHVLAPDDTIELVQFVGGG